MEKSKRFEGKTAVITGAGSGIGRSIAEALASEGAAVVVNDLDEGLAGACAEAIRRAGGRAVSCPGDAGELAVLEQLVRTAVDRFDHLDIAIANAGITTYGDFFRYQPAQLRQLLAVNLHGTFFLAQFAARQMREQGQGGRILLMSSVTGLQAHRYLAAYGMTKGGLQMLAKGLVPELSPYGITINALAPGATLTERTERENPDYAGHWQAITPTGRVSNTSDMARAALFLVAPDAGQLTGQTLLVDGGWAAMSPEPPL
jgi:glucose 1-dehydrogenase